MHSFRAVCCCFFFQTEWTVLAVAGKVALWIAPKGVYLGDAGEQVAPALVSILILWVATLGCARVEVGHGAVAVQAYVRTQVCVRAAM